MESKAEKRKKRCRRRLTAAAIALLCICAAGGGMYVWQRGRNEDTAVQIAAGEGETLQYARIDNIVGNEIEVSLLQPNEEETQSGETGVKAVAESRDETDNAGQVSVSQNGASREEASQSASALEDGVLGENLPQDGGLGNGVPQGADIPRGAVPGGAVLEGTAGGRTAGGNTGFAASYTQIGETAFYQIPVGTDVITQLGVTTTFSRLSAGEVIALLMEEGTDNILRIWIVE